LLAGIILRIYNIGAESVWYDEAFSVKFSKVSALAQIKWILQGGGGYEPNPPLYFILLHFWARLLGYSEFSIRLLSACLGSLSIVAIYALGKLLFTRRAGLVAALILAVSVFHIQFSQEARTYSLTAFLTIITFYSLVKIANHRSVWWSLSYIASTLLMLYSHYYGLFILIAQNIFCLTLFFRYGKAGQIRVGRWVILQTIVILSFLPGIVHLFRIKDSMQKAFWIEAPTLERLGNYLIQYSGSIYLLIVFTFFALVCVIGANRISRLKVLSNVFAANEDKNHDPSIGSGQKVYLLALWFALPILAPFLISVISTPMFVGRYAIGATLPFYLLASRGVDCLRSKYSVLAVGLIIVAVSILNLTGFYRIPYKHQWREVMDVIERNSASGDIIVIFPAYEDISAKYYKTRDDLKLIPMADTFPILTDLGKNRVWVVTHEHPMNSKLLREGLGGIYDFELERHFVKLYLFKLRQK